MFTGKTNKSIILFILSGLIIFSCIGDTSNTTITAEDVYISFTQVGLEVQNPHLLIPSELESYKTICSGALFYVPSIAPDCIGRIFECKTVGNLSGLVINIVDSDRYYSWLVVKLNILLQLDGRIPEYQIIKYANAIPGSGFPSIRKPMIITPVGENNISTETQPKFQIPSSAPSLTNTPTMTPSQIIIPSNTPMPTNTYRLCGSICHDGWLSESTGSGTCSYHGGVRGPWYCNN